MTFSITRRQCFHTVAAAVALTVSVAAHAADITGAGATFPYPV